MTTTRTPRMATAMPPIVADPEWVAIMSRTPRNTATPTAVVPSDDITPDAVPTADTATPTVPTTNDPADYVTAYGAASGATRTAIRNAATARMTAALDAGDVPTAMAFRTAIRDDMVSVAATPTVVDYDALVVTRIHALVHAAAAIATGAIRPTGVPADHTYGDTVRAAFDAYGIDVPAESSAIIDDVRAIASDRVARSTERNDIGSVVTRAFADAPVGTVMTVAAVCRAGATPTYTPGAGAVAARMFGGSGVDGFTAIDTDANGPRRIRRDV